jgi:hypothetical protein
MASQKPGQVKPNPIGSFGPEKTHSEPER